MPDEIVLLKQWNLFWVVICAAEGIFVIVGSLWSAARELYIRDMVVRVDATANRVAVALENATKADADQMRQIEALTRDMRESRRDLSDLVLEKHREIVQQMQYMLGGRSQGSSVTNQFSSGAGSIAQAGENHTRQQSS